MINYSIWNSDSQPFLGGDTHFEKEKFATHLEHTNYNQTSVLYKQMPNSYAKSSKVRFGIILLQHTKRNSQHTNVS
jgi:hypothetical protein